MKDDRDQVYNLRHSGVYVHDMDGMISFYTSMFNMTIASRAVEKGNYIETVLAGYPGIELDVCKMTFPSGGMIELIKIDRTLISVPEGMAVYETGRHHIAITVPSTDEAFKKLKDQGCECLSDPTDNVDNTARVLFAKDPEGNYLELVEML